MQTVPKNAEGISDTIFIKKNTGKEPWSFIFSLLGELSKKTFTVSNFPSTIDDNNSVSTTFYLCITYSIYRACLCLGELRA